MSLGETIISIDVEKEVVRLQEDSNTRLASILKGGRDGRSHSLASNFSEHHLKKGVIYKSVDVGSEQKKYFASDIKREEPQQKNTADGSNDELDDGSRTMEELGSTIDALIKFVIPVWYIIYLCQSLPLETREILYRSNHYLQ